jgi:hypothetical protein
MGFQTIGGLFGAELAVDGAAVDVVDGCDAEVVARDEGMLLMVGVVAAACEEESCVRVAREKTTTDPRASAASARGRIQNGGRRRA